ncbi:MAG: ATP-binding cassette domain-containing protein, partial [Propionibacteriaceae bacterium]|nr:ATP-binding cassette domain-containing protein [Propionibacteriaceae bacterium]
MAGDAVTGDSWAGDAVASDRDRMPAGSWPLIELVGLARSIGGGPELALRDASGVIERGEFVAVVGPSGSGKTTLLSLLGLLDRPTAGSYRFDGVLVSDLDERARDRFRGRRLGFVFQNSYLVGSDTVGLNVSLGLRVRGLARRQRDPLIRRALGRVGLADAIDRRADDLSGGEKQRVAVARALVTGPQVILADEPTGALDTASTRRLVGLLQEVNATGTTVVVVTHDPLVAEAADRVVEITDGVLRPAPTGGGGHPGRHRRAAGMSRLDPADAAPATPGGGRRRTRLGQELVDALATPLSRPLHSLLVLLAYALGVAALVAATGLTQTTTAQIVARLTDAASTELRVTDNQDTAADFPTAAAALNSWAAARTVADRLEGLTGVAAAAPVRTFTVVGNTVLRLGGPTVAAVEPAAYQGHLMVTDERYLALQGLQAASGRLDPLSLESAGAVVVLGATAAETLGVVAADPNVTITVNGRSVAAAAVLRPSGQVALDDTLYFSPGVLPLLTDRFESYWLVRAEAGYAEPLARAVPLFLAPADSGRIVVSTVAQLAQLQAGVSADLTRLLGVIGAVILVLSGLTAGTTMFLSVHHREP